MACFSESLPEHGVFLENRGENLEVQASLQDLRQNSSSVKLLRLRSNLLLILRQVIDLGEVLNVLN